MGVNEQQMFMNFSVTTQQTLGDSDHSYQQLKGLITMEQREYAIWVIAYITQFFNVAGILSNSFSIAVFNKLGFAEPSNISLMALSVCDLVAATLSSWICLCTFPVFRYAPLPFSAVNLAILTGSAIWAQVVRTIAWITAFISFERCLCILLPLKVKRLITPKTTSIIILVIVVLTITPLVPVYLRWVFVWRFYPSLNRTLLDIGQIEDPILIQVIHIYNTIIMGVIVPVLAFVLVVVCTVFLVIHLRRSSAWRQSVASTKSQGTELSDSKGNSQQSQKKGISSKEERLVKMVTSVASIFIACFTPPTLLSLGTVFNQEFTAFGRYRHFYFVSFVSSYLAQSVSGSVNIFIYYNMGSKYRTALRSIVGLGDNLK